MRMYCKFNTMRTNSLFFILYGERPVQRLRYCETRIMFTDQNKTSFEGRQVSREVSHIAKLPWWPCLCFV